MPPLSLTLPTTPPFDIVLIALPQFSSFHLQKSVDQAVCSPGFKNKSRRIWQVVLVTSSCFRENVQYAHAPHPPCFCILITFWRRANISWQRQLIIYNTSHEEATWLWKPLFLYVPLYITRSAYITMCRMQNFCAQIGVSVYRTHIYICISKYICLRICACLLIQLHSICMWKD